MAAELGLGATSPTALRFGLGADGIGARYVFAGLSQSYGDSGWLPGRAGLVVATQLRPARAFGPQDGRDVDVDLLYLQLEQRLRTPPVAFVERLGARFEATATALVAGHRVRDGEDAGQTNLQGDLRLAGAVRFDHRTRNVSGTYRVGAQLSPGIDDVRDNDAPQVPRPALDGVFVMVDERFRLPARNAGSSWILAGATVVVNELGIRGRLEGGVASGPVAVTGNVEGRLRDGDAVFLDGSGRRVGASLLWDMIDMVRLQASISAPLERLASDGATAFVGANVRY
jgi:hypothetical protein